MSLVGGTNAGNTQQSSAGSAQSQQSAAGATPTQMSATGKVQIPLDGPDQTLSETRVYDLVSDKVRSGPFGSPTSSRTLSGRRHF